MVVVSGVKIRRARLGAGLSQAELARAISTDQGNIGRWENDRNAPRADALAAIAEATGQAMEFFYSGDAEKEAALPGDPFRGSNSSAPSSGRGKRRSGAREAGGLAA